MGEQYFAFSAVPDRTANYFWVIGHCDWYDPHVQLRFCAIYYDPDWSP